MGKCPFCGNNIDDDTLYCRSCGKRIYPELRTNKRGSGKEVWIVLLLIFMWPIGLISMWLTKTFSQKTRWIITLIFAAVILITAVSVAYKAQEIRLLSGEQTVETVTEIAGESTIEQPKVLTQNDFTAIVFIIIAVTAVIIYFIVHKSKSTITKYSDYSSKSSTSRADIYNQNDFVQENIPEKSPTLIKCPVCNKDVSNQAISCPNCGHPIAKMNEIKSDSEGVQVDYSNIIDYRKTQKKKVNLKKIICIVFVLIFACYFIDILRQNTKNTSDNAQSNSIINGTEVMTEITTETISEIDNYDYRTLVENVIKEAIPEAKFTWFTSYRTWTDGTFILVENKFEVNNIKHKYVARCGGGKIFHLTIDDEVVFYDEDGQWDFMMSD